LTQADVNRKGVVVLLQRNIARLRLGEIEQMPLEFLNSTPTWPRRHATS
jgi:hypothetical protein